jgi:acetyl-CoA carboxylase biotin carboxyl carrier protein
VAVARNIEADIVGNVLQVVAHEGQTVTEGDVVVMLESMKMEIPVVSDYAGTLTKIIVKEGDVVKEHDVIAVVD